MHSALNPISDHKSIPEIINDDKIISFQYIDNQSNLFFHSLEHYPNGKISIDDVNILRSNLHFVKRCSNYLHYIIYQKRFYKFPARRICLENTSIDEIVKQILQDFESADQYSSRTADRSCEIIGNSVCLQYTESKFIAFANQFFDEYLKKICTILDTFGVDSRAISEYIGKKFLYRDVTFKIPKNMQTVGNTLFSIEHVLQMISCKIKDMNVMRIDNVDYVLSFMEGNGKFIEMKKNDVYEFGQH